MHGTKNKQQMGFRRGSLRGKEKAGHSDHKASDRFRFFLQGKHGCQHCDTEKEHFQVLVQIVLQIFFWFIFQIFVKFFPKLFQELFPKLFFSQFCVQKLFLDGHKTGRGADTGIFTG